MFVNQVLFREKALMVSFFDFLECWNAVYLKKLSNSGQQKPLKSSKFRMFSEMLTSSKFFVKFQCFHKKITKSMSFPPKNAN